VTELLYEATRKVFWTGVRIPPAPPEAHVLDKRNRFTGSNGVCFWWGCI